MLRFLLAFAVPAVACAIAAALLPAALPLWWYEPMRAGDLFPSLTISIVMTPLLGAFIGAEIVHYVRPRRHWIGPRRASMRIAGAGAAASLLAIALTSVALVFLEAYILTSLIAAGAAALSSAIAIVVALPPRRPGRCLFCGYDLRASTGARCPECGAAAIGPGAARLHGADTVQSLPQ
jgi:hypothetical protein